MVSACRQPASQCSVATFTGLPLIAVSWNTRPTSLSPAGAGSDLPAFAGNPVASLRRALLNARGIPGQAGQRLALFSPALGAGF